MKAIRRVWAVAVVLAALQPLPPSAFAGATPSLVADYRFGKTLKSVVGTPPDLAPLGPAANCFLVDKVGNQLRTVLGFPKDNGLVLSPTTPSMPSDHYTVAMRVRLDTVSGYRRLLDFSGGVLDCGLYIYNGTLKFFCLEPGSGTYPINTYGLIVLTRDASGTVTGYLDGVQDLTFSDTTSKAVIDSNNVLRFFRDNECPAPCNEDSGGEVSRIRIYDDALSAEQVAALGSEQTTTTTIPTPLCGDGNGSDKITASDALVALKAAVGGGCCLVVCDVNSNGNVTASDALAILKKAVGTNIDLTCPF